MGDTLNTRVSLLHSVPEGEIKLTLKDLNIVTSPNLSRTRRTSRCSLNELGVGWILIWTVREANALTLESRGYESIVAARC